MKTISLRQPWAYLLCAGIKDIENRTWKLPEKYKGERVLIHASGKPLADSSCISHLLTREQYTHLIEVNQGASVMDVMYLEHFNSAIIGSVRFVDCMINHQSIWAEKSHYEVNLALHPLRPIYNWVVADPILFDKPILDVKGKLSFWESFHEPVICPECGQIQCAKVEDTIPFATYIHECEKCGYTIMESEWDKVK